MKGDFSRKTFEAARHYSGVLMQQGRVQLDADWNEQLAIQRHRDYTEAEDVIGGCGAPKHDAGFAIAPAPGGADLLILPGRFYAHGRLCELEATPVAATWVSATQVTVAEWFVDGAAFGAGQYVQVTGDGLPAAVARLLVADAATLALTLDPALPAAFSSASGLQVRRLATYLTQADLPDPAYASGATPPALTLADGSYVVYLDVWPRHVTALDDDLIREKALGGPDTATRVKTLWQVKLWPGPEEGDPLPADTGCGSDLAGWDALTAPPTGRLAARATPGEEPGPCLLPPGAGYLGLENQLYRVEIHQGGTLGADTVTFKWSRDNGSVVKAITPLSGGGHTVEAGPDDVLGLANGQWVEQVDDGTELNAVARALFQFSRDPLTDAVTLSFPVDESRHPQLRRWDSPGAVTIPWPPAGDGWTPLENGVEVRFQAGTYRTGDFWLVPARTVLGDVEWPRDAAGTPLLRPRKGIAHHYCRLGVVHVTGGVVTVDDCRTLFPPLNELKTSYSCCTFTVGDGVKYVGDFTLIQDAVDHLPAEGGQICIFPGTYTENVVIDGRKNVQIKGCGARTRVVSRPPNDNGVAEAVFHLLATENVHIESLAVVAAETAPGILADGKEPNVRLGLDKVGLTAARASAIRVRGSRDVSIQHCHVEMTDPNGGAPAIHLQAEDALVRENVITGTLRGMPPEEAFALEGARPVSGLQVAGGSARVRVHDNLIQGVSGQGITLGSVAIVDANGEPTDPGGGGGQPDDPCDNCDEPSTGDDPEDPNDDGRRRIASEGRVIDVDIRRNRIFECGLDGVGVVRFFDMTRASRRRAAVLIEDLAVVDNRIQRCVQRRFAAIPPDMVDQMAYGGVSLSFVAGLVVRDNRIEDLGRGGQLPVCGVFAVLAAGFEAGRNHILVAGGPLSPNDVRLGRRGGIHIVYALPLEPPSLATRAVRAALAGRRFTPAAIVEENTVDVVRGQALSLGAMGRVSVVSNRFISHGLAPEDLAALLRAGGAANVLGHLAALVSIANLAAPSGGSVNMEGAVYAKSPQADAGTGATLEAALFPRKVLFDDNQCVLDLTGERENPPAGAAGGALLPSIMVLSLDDVGFSDNQCDCLVTAGTMPAAAILLGYLSVRAVANRFDESLPSTFFSLASLALMNMTVNNQSTHCIWAWGAPGFLQSTPNHVIFGANCPDAAQQVAGVIRRLRPNEPEAPAGNDPMTAVLPSALRGVDQLRASGLQGLAVAADAQQGAFELERDRLARRLGPEHERVRALDGRVEEAAALRREVAREVQRAQTPAPVPGNDDWTVHGYVHAPAGTPVEGLAVSLVDARGTWQRGLGFAQTDARGYFRLTARVPERDPAAPALTVRLRVTDAERHELFRAAEDLTVRAGAVDYREITLDGGRRAGGPPEEEGPGGQAPPPETPTDPARPRKREKK